MRESRIHHHWPKIILFLAMLLGSLCSAQIPSRNLTGVVLDRHREPLKGAIVQVQNENTNSIVSYITEANGNFSFKRLNGDTDYRVWATYRNKRSKNKELSRFDSKTRPFLQFILKLQ